MKEDKILKSHIIEVVNNQIRDNDPKETKITYKRLIDQGYSEKESKELIASVVMTEIYDTLKNNEMFNEKRFISRLEKLPDLSWLD